MAEGIGIGYSVLSKADSKVTISCKDSDNVKQVVTVSESTWLTAKKGIDAGIYTPWEILHSYVNTKANDAKAISAEKAEAEELKAKKAKALAIFEKDLATWLWSTQVKTLASRVIELRQEQEAIEEVPYSIDLAGYDRIAPSKSCQRGEYRFTMFKGIPSLVVGLPDPLPRQMMLQGEIAIALHAFRVEAANEVTIPDVLASDNATKNFDVDNKGSIVFNVKVKRSGGGNSNGGKKVKVRHIASGRIFESQSDAGLEFYPDLAYPHKKVSELAKKGDTFEFV